MPERSAGAGRFRKKPVVIEAEQWLGGSEQQVRLARWMGDAYVDYAPNGRIFIETLEGTVWASVGDWIIKGVKGEFYPCKDEIFRMTYEEVTYDAAR